MSPILPSWLTLTQSSSEAELHISAISTPNMAAKFGVDGWHMYDYVFHSQATINLDTDWSEVSPSLIMAFLSGRLKSQVVQPCSPCHEPDRQDCSCALTPLSQTNKHPIGSKPLAHQHSHPSDGKPHLCISWNQGACMFPGMNASTGMNVVSVESPTLRGIAP